MGFFLSLISVRLWYPPPAFIPLAVPVLSCKTNFLAPLEPNEALFTAKKV